MRLRAFSELCNVCHRPAAPANLNRQDSDSKKPKAEPQKTPSAAAPPVAGKKPAGADVHKTAADSVQPAFSQAAAGAGSQSLLVASDFAELDTPPTVFQKAVPKEISQPAKKVRGVYL